MQKITRRKPRVHPLDRLRTRIWFAQADKLSGMTSLYAYWIYVDKRKASRSRWYLYPTGEAVPEDITIKRMEVEVPGTAAIFNALFWSVLKGEHVSREEISKELDTLAEGYTRKHELMQLSFWMSAIEENPNQLEDLAVRTIFESRNGEDFLQLTILIMALADETGNKKLWNYMCGWYRDLLPLYIPTIPWPFKNEVFDELDNYVQERVISGVSRKSIRSDWRDAKSKVQECVKDEYFLTIDSALIERRVDREAMPKLLAQQLAKLLAAEFCKTENLMQYSWHLCDPISADIADVIYDIQLFDDGKITVQRIIRYLKSLGYFDVSCSGFKTYSKFEHVRDYHLNFVP